MTRWLRWYVALAGTVYAAGWLFGGTLYLLPYDAWIGWFHDRPKRRLYLQPFPCLGVRVEFGERGEDRP